MTQAYELAIYGDYENLSKLIQQQPDSVNAVDEYGFTPLHGMGSEEHYDVVRLLIASGANVNARNVHGTMPLHLAASAEMVTLLVRSGAEINATDDDGNTPLHISVSNRDGYEAIEQLLKMGADPTIPNKWGALPIDTARSREDNEAIALLLPFKPQTR